LNTLDKDKYGIRSFLEKGHLSEKDRESAYRQYYSVKFANMCEKQAEALYEDYLSRVRSEYD